MAVKPDEIASFEHRTRLPRPILNPSGRFVRHETSFWPSEMGYRMAKRMERTNQAFVDGSADICTMLCLISYRTLCMAVAQKGELASEKVVVGFPEDWGRICITTAGAAGSWRGRCQV
ncbi:uncharacterized protein BDCG_08824 [Blastomyces dermatitidis ER-3]|uniref:Uncharacterized protein n=1 Tax=Ajellomyces dermatitidis (strain ER-3 / ATCC MYA-2586) TaxID=559297 RepID=A0ABM9YG93_AJEDR|nr:uncharacterized protein BDCG_08824 [Blastomyces dermatitidis ER-3]EEQ85555.2 hypothetical protein BDCG_08824 [Blastomyces dermatitidis ER-3]EQL29052.1 hypothetical protein BDFG_08258 [Blastomyces dermatitidis ATCC 26199]